MIKQVILPVTLFVTTLIVAIYCLLIFKIQPMVEKSENEIVEHKPYMISPKTKVIHDNLIIADWHSDSLLWARDLTKRSNYGHVDIPRLLEGNIAIQMFTVVTKSPKSQNYKRNTDGFDNITLLSVVQLWPVSTWNSLTERALYQAEKLHKFAEEEPQKLFVVKSKEELKSRLSKRKALKKEGKDGFVIGMLGIEGLHALDGKIENIKLLYDAGYRMMGLLHFFDNKIGGSLHGVSRGGLTGFGRKTVRRLNELSIIIDLAHSSPGVVKDVLKLSTKPVVISHTGMYGKYKGPRNISDDLMKEIAKKGGLIGIGYWRGAIGNTSPKNIAASIQYAINLVGVDHVALGSDFDGSVKTSFDTSEIAVITQELIKAGLSKTDISKVMGLNSVNFLMNNLPDK
ncbi:MAG: peptidase M19 [Desulfobacterales bacterium]|nr:peptidase M19 [Desulfobacterales bacterium]